MERGRAVKTQSSRSRSKERSRSPRVRSRDRAAGGPNRIADKRVYISNIPYDSRWQDIKDLFRKEVGEVAFVELFNDENEKPRGCGIIEFESSAIAKKAIEKMHRHEMGGRKIVVKEDYDVQRDATGRIRTGPAGGGSGASGGGSVNRDRDRSRERDRDRDRDWDRRRDSSPQQSIGGGGWKFGNTYGLSQQFLESLGIEETLISKIFVSNLDFRVDEKKLKEVFRLAGRVLYVELNKDKEGKSRGHGTVEFEHPVEAVQAISMFNNQELFDRRMHIRMDRLSDPIADLAKNRLPEGLKGVGMGLGANGQPLVDVSKNLPSNNPSAVSSAANASVAALLGNSFGGQAALTNALANNPIATAMNMGGVNLGLSAMMNPQAMENMGVSNAAAVAAANAFGMPMGTLTAQNQFANAGALQMSQLAAGNLAGLQQANAANVNSMMQQNPSSGTSGSGSGGNMNQTSQFQNTGNSQSGSGSQNYRDLEYGYSTQTVNSVYSTPSSNYNTAYQREKQQFGEFGNGSAGTGVLSGGGGGSNSVSNTVIVANLPPTCTWQMLKAKFRECGEVLFAEMRDKNTGIVRFASERDAERAVKVYDQSRVDGRTVDVHFV